MRRGNSHDQHHESPGNSRQSSRKSNPSIHSIHSLHNNGKIQRKRSYLELFGFFLLLVVTTINNSDDPWVFRASLSQLLNRISGNELLRDNHHHHHLTAAQQQAAMVQSQQIDITTARIYLKDIICYFSLLEGGTPEQKLECKKKIIDVVYSRFIELMFSSL